MRKMKNRHRIRKHAVLAVLTGSLLLAGLAACGSKSMAEDMVSQSTSMPGQAAGWDGTYSNGIRETGWSAETDMLYNESGIEKNLTGEEEIGLTLYEASDRKTIKTAYLSLQTLDYDECLAAISRKVAEVNAYLESANEYGSGYYSSRRSAEYVVRVPQEKMEAFVSALGDVATIVSKNITENDVTLEYVDTESRIKTLQVEQERLLELLAEAQNLDAIIALEGRLSDVRYEIESYTSRLRTYDNQITYSTVRVEVSEVMRVQQQEPKTLGERISNGWSDTMYQIKTGTQDFVVWVVVNLPYLLFWAAVIVVFAGLLRKGIRSRRREKSLKKVGMEEKKEHDTEVDDKK